MSAARAFGPRTLGIVLTGTSADGVHGPISVRAAGGLSIVQDPREAPHATMPLNAIRRNRMNATMGVEDLAAAVTALAAGKTVGSPPRRAGSQVAP